MVGVAHLQDVSCHYVSILNVSAPNVSAPNVSAPNVSAPKVSYAPTYPNYERILVTTYPHRTYPMPQHILSKKVSYCPTYPIYERILYSLLYCNVTFRSKTYLKYYPGDLENRPSTKINYLKYTVITIFRKIRYQPDCYIKEMFTIVWRCISIQFYHWAKRVY